ncbi:MAG: hypothetical protein HN583_08505 [Kordiimonadaceae bacterium]|jgi:hypothetical protein|nr:hypothetical protein [Kordiimonadaceae bacterium]MBT6466117.1 hypothetical protein [Kordiimonadaceae bacterium]MBT7545210.1 hypothetical protein [Kordiimonadaceae bacterium]MBT7605712.1 hypothetical protein [Kordiimonadaceae bacterium]MDG1005096.1 hypothetical protein [Emcibacteraceae bacterium]
MDGFFSFSLYQLLVYFHLLLFVLWLGADVGVFMLGQHFRKRDKYDLSQRLILLKLLINLDMVPRTAWALMVPSTITLLAAGEYWQISSIALVFSWLIGGLWLWLIWDAHLHDQTPRATRDRKIEFILKILMTVFYIGLGSSSLVNGEPLFFTWVALKALIFGLIFAAAIMIDIVFKPVGPQLANLLSEGSSDETELPLLRTMNRTRIWVWIVYALLLITALLGNAKPL